MREAVSQAVRESMKARDAARTGTLRMIAAAIKDRDIRARGQGRGGGGRGTARRAATR